MNILEKAGLTEKERVLLKKVLRFSCLGCVIVVAGAWGIRKLLNAQQASSDNLPVLMNLATGKGDLLPVDLEAHQIAAELYIKTDRPEKSIEHLQRIVAFKRNDRRILFQLATATLESRQYQSAVQLFQKLLESGETDSLSLSIHARYGLCLYYLGRIEESLAVLRQAFSLDATNPEVSCYLGQVLASQDVHSAEALRHLEDAVGWNKNFTEGWYQLGRYFMNLGEYEKARIYLLRVLEIEPIHVKTHSRLGMVYYYLNQPAMAKQSYEMALSLNPHDYNTHYNLGELYYSVYNDSMQAAVEFQSALKDNPDHIQANFKMGLICMGNTMAREAVQYFTRVITIDPYNTRAWLQLGSCYEQLGMNQQALQTYQRITSYDALNDVALHKIRILTKG